MLFWRLLRRISSALGVVAVLITCRIDYEAVEGRLWREVSMHLPRVAPVPPVVRMEPRFDLLSSELRDLEAVVHAPTPGAKLPEGFQTVAPGLPRGIQFEQPSGFAAAAVKGSQVSLASAMNRTVVVQDQGTCMDDQVSLEGGKGDEEVDELLPETSDYDFAGPKTVKPQRMIETGSWARPVDANHVPADYETVVPELAFAFPFELDAFQKQAVYHLERGESVFIAAHTSAGKTVVAEYAIALARRHMTKAIYTSPIKALSNQKFRDFKQTFGDVGLLTGDVQMNAEGGCLIMTTEILRSMLYRSAELISDVEFVIFDEVHYVNDQERGVVWEEVIIMLPPHVTLIMLSATIPNTIEFADWVGRTRKSEIFVISTLKRPVPLEHHLYVAKGEMVKIVDQNKNFLEAGYRQALQLQRGDAAKKTLPNMVSGAVAPRNTQGGIFRGIKQEKSLWVDVVYFLRKRALLPAVIFTFSKRKCEENADALLSTDLNSASEKSAIRIFLDRAVAKLKVEDRELPQIIRMRELLSLGLAVHHSGLLPIMKEAVEMLFSRGLVKVLFATETFAMGVNMPTRTVVFSSIRKHDGTGFRNLLPGEYTQMAGRAGRRGLDPTGTVLIACPEEVPGEAVLRTMILGQPTKLVSQFRLTYAMLLNLLRVQALRVEEMIKKSFSENAGQKMLPQTEERLAESERLLETAEQLNCRICEEDIGEMYGAAVNSIDWGRVLWERVLGDSRWAAKLFEPGRILLINNGMFQNMPVVVLKVLGGGAGCSCMAVWNERERSRGSREAGVEVLPLPLTVINWPDLERPPLARDTFTFGAGQIVSVCEHRITIPTDLGNTTIYRPKDLDAIQDAFLAWIATHCHRGRLEEATLPNFKLLEVDERRLNRAELLSRLPSYGCNKCPDLLEHYAVFHRRRMLTERLAELQFRISDSSLLLLSEYHARLALLKTLNYVDAAGHVQLKGRVACELNTVHELLTTELLLENAFQESEPAEIVALLSTMVFQERPVMSADELPKTTLPETLQRGVKRMQEMALQLASLESAHGVPSTDLSTRLNYALVPVVYEWARNTPFTVLTGLTEVLEGSIVRCIVRLDETCREIRGAARVMGDPRLFRKMEEASSLIKRDICFASSLYL